MRNRTLACMVLWMAGLAGLAGQERAPSQGAVPADIARGEATIFSEGTRMAADTYVLQSNAGKRLPCILMAHGWGGTAALLRPEAVFFAKAGYFVAAFDYRGWGRSESRVILTHPAPPERPGGKFTAEVQEVREVVDPIDMGIDW